MKVLKNKLFKHITTVSKNAYFDALENIVNKYNNTVRITTNMKPIVVSHDSYIKYNVDSTEKGPKFKVGDRLRI